MTRELRTLRALVAEREKVKALRDEVNALRDDLRDVAKAITNGAQDTLWMGDSIADPTIVDFICNITGDEPQFIGLWERATREGGE